MPAESVPEEIPVVFLKEKKAAEERTPWRCTCGKANNGTDVKCTCGNWRCSCGRVHSAYLSTCVCGLSKQDAVSGRVAQKPAPAEATKPTEQYWKCACGKVNAGKFCSDCGAPKPAAEGWKCACGSVNKGKFCPECGAKKPAGVPQYKCDKCGWEPEKGTTPPKFCPECGDRFDDGDVK